MEGIINLFSKINFKTKENVDSYEIEKEKHNKEIIDEIKSVQNQISAIRCCFQLETDFDLIDSYVMQLTSLEHRYAFLLKQAKQDGVIAFTL